MFPFPYHEAERVCIRFSQCGYKKTPPRSAEVQMYRIGNAYLISREMSLISAVAFGLPQLTSMIRETFAVPGANLA